MLPRLSAIGLALLSSAAVLAAQAPEQQNQDSFKFRTGVELINVNATVTDQSGRFVGGLSKDDFRVFDDEQPQTVTHFSAERVPVSLGIVLDTSGSMDGEKMYAAKQALERFLFQLLDPEDEVFLYRFDNNPELVEGWTRDKQRVSDALRRIQPRGGTALYDAVADAVRLAQQGHNKKKAVVIISDGNDTSSRTDVYSLKQLIRETEVLVYAVGIDAVGSLPYAGGLTPAVGLHTFSEGDRGTRSRCRSRCRAAAGPHRSRRPRRGRRRGPATAGTRTGGRAPPTTASTSPRFATSPTTAAAVPRSSARRAIWIPQHRASPMN